MISKTLHAIIIPFLIFWLFNMQGNAETIDNTDGNSFRRYALIVGANNAGFGRTRLRFAVSDANAMKNLLQSLGGIEPEDCISAMDPDRRNFILSMQTAYTKVKEAKTKYKRAEFISYDSGHADEG